MKAEDLRQAYSLLRRKRYSQLIRKLEAAIFYYREDTQFYYLLGLACLHTGDYGGAHSYINRCLQLEPDHLEGLLVIAAVELKRGNTTAALSRWLRILEFEPNNRTARRGLNLARTAPHGGSIQSRIRNKGLHWLLPRHKTPLRLVLLRFTLAIVILTALSGATLLIIQRLQLPPSRRGGSEHLLYAAQIEQIIDYSGSFRYVLTERQIRAALKQIGDLFHDQRDNLARREINRLLNSNAGMEVKQRVSLLTEYLARPDFTNFRDNFDYADIVAEPWLYDGCYVRWNGRIANLNRDAEPVRFDLLVGYETEQRLEGIIPAIVRFETNLEAGMAIETIGRLHTGEPALRIEIDSIRPILP